MKQIWKVLLFFIIFCSEQKAEAQIVPLAKGLPDTAIAACTKGSDLFILTKKSNASHDSMKVFHWNGQQWSKVLSFYFTSNTLYRTVNVMRFYNEELYIGGLFDTVSNIPGYRNLIKWDGKNLSPIYEFEDFYMAQIRYLEVYDNNLFIGTDYYIKRWNGSEMFSADDVASGYSKATQGQLNLAGNKLYAQLGLNKGDGVYRIFSIWNGNLWNPIPNPVLPNGFVFLSFMTTDYKSNLAVLPHEKYDTIQLWNGLQWSSIAPGLFQMINKNSRFYHFIAFKNEIWISTYSNGKYIFYKWDGKSWGKALEIVSTLTTPEQKLAINLVVSDNALYIYGAVEDIANKNTNYVGRLTQQAKFTGIVYNDLNKNCIKENNEPPLNNSFISISNNQFTLINTDSLGNYSFYADSGIHILTTIPHKYWEQTCPTNNRSITVGAELDSVYKNDFAIAPKNSVQDVRITLTGSTGWRARQGFTENYTLCYENVGTTKASGKIALMLDSAFTNFSSTPSPNSYTYPFAEWEFDSLEIGQKRCFTFKARLDSATLNDSVMLIAGFDGGDGWIDSTLNDNIDTLKQRVVAAVDPNDKSAFPSGDITKETKELRYQIRFQNVGTDTAYRVTVIDTIDTNLPLTKVIMNSASHKYKLDIKNNVFKWTFDGIMLPDSNINEPLSHGFINYSAQIKPGLAIGTEIKNTAYIYFDYQKPVITNTARSKMTEPVGIREEKTTFGNTLNIYPNPAANKVYLKNTGNKIQCALIYNSLGQQIQAIVLQAHEVTEWNTNYLPNGLYFIQADCEQTHKLLIQH